MAFPHSNNIFCVGREGSKAKSCVNIALCAIQQLIERISSIVFAKAAPGIRGVKPSETAPNRNFLLLQ